MPRNDGVRFTSSSLRVSVSPLHHPLPLFSHLQFASQTLITSTLARTKSAIDQFVINLKTHKRTSPFQSKSSLLCSASLALTRLDESATSGASEAGVAQHKSGYSGAGRHEEERVLISEVLVRNKDGEELERKDLENEALTALKACRPSSALTVREVQEDVHRIISSGYFCSCMPVAVDTRDGIRLVFQGLLHCYLHMGRAATAAISIQVNILWRLMIWTFALISLPVRVLTALQRETLLEMHLHELQIELENLVWNRKELVLRMAIKECRMMEAMLAELEDENDQAIVKIELLESEVAKF